MSIPNPISLLQLREYYDTFLSSDDSDVRSLRVVCSILMTLLLENDASNNEWKSRLQQTARRSYLIEHYRALQKGAAVESDDDDESFLFRISTQPTTDWRTTFGWSIVPPQQEDIVLSMDRDELATEEATLWEMANTPIPLEDIVNNNNDQSARNSRMTDLKRKIRSEWCNDLE